MIAEEQLELADIQGAIVPGFKKDHAALSGHPNQGQRGLQGVVARACFRSGPRR